MPDSIHSIHTTPAVPTEHFIDRPNSFAEQQAAADMEMMQKALNSTSAAKGKQANTPRSQKANTLAVAPDTAAADTAPAHAAKQTLSIQMERPHTAQVFAKADSSDNAGMDIASWVILAVVVLFMLISFRFRRNFKYINNLMHETVDSARRRNMFADTMRETTFLTLLILLTIAGSGLLLSAAVAYCNGTSMASPGDFPPNLWYCLGITAGYYLLQWIAYIFIGNTFTSHTNAARWVQGFKAGTALMGPILLPLALLGIFYPEVLPYTLISALFIYFLSRILFIFKGIRIFSGKSTYFLLFLYYLCSVEIVPVLLIWHIARSY
ncbi:MAG: DUF4271 domain-containing protein [Muribaculaceae bacterium]|nr:DUF4271 domain-containing protein [Muribaculaceae bacterium]